MADSPDHVPGWLNFIIGGVSGMVATSIVQPLDLMQTRTQVVGPAGKKSTLSMVQSIVSQEGFAGFYTGMSAALFRQATYGAARLGVFNAMLNTYDDMHGTPSLKMKIAIGMFSGGIGAFICIPAEAALHRLSFDEKMPVGHRRKYRNIFEAGIRIPREEGITTLWRGALPTIAKASVVNGAQLATYAQTRQYLLVVFNDGIYIHFWSSIFAALATTYALLPVDVIKDRLQKAEKGTSKSYTVLNMFLKEGTGALWNGYWSAFARTGPHIVLTFMLLEQLNALYFKFI